MRKLIKLDKIYDIKFDSKIHSFLSPEHIYIPIETGFDLLKKQNSKVLMGEAILENKLKKIKSSISGKVIGTSKLICDGVEKQCIVIENNYEEDSKEVKNIIKNISSEDIINNLFIHNLDKYADKLKKLNIENLVINGMEDEPYFENNPFVLNKYASDILKITDKLINAFDIKNAYIAIKSNDTENINLFLSKIGTYTNINLSLIEDKYLLGSDFFLLENMNLKDNSLVISAQDLLSIYNSVVYLCDIFNSLNINIKDNYLCIYNGLMTGYEVDYKKCIVTSNMKGVIIIPKFNEEEKPCNLCGMCYKICPVKVNPKNVMDTGKKSKNCIDCGLCTYICPCKINLRKYLRGQK